MSPSRVSSLSSSSSASWNPSKPFCRFYFLQRDCRYGSNCAFSHDQGDLSMEEVLKQIPCPYFARGCCRYGEYCQLKHDEDDLEDKKCRATTTAKATETMSLENVVLPSEAVTTATTSPDSVCCGICLEIPRKYGLLSCCNHVFCFDCLMEWRTGGSEEAADRRVCPTCRKRSNCVIPSPILPQDPLLKAKIWQQHSDKLAVIPCKRFRQKLGSCPFGKDCFYAHVDESGLDIKNHDKTMQELYLERTEKKKKKRRRFTFRRNAITNDMDELLELMFVMHMMGRGGELRRILLDHEDYDEDDDDDDYDDFLSYHESNMEDDDNDDNDNDLECY